MGDGGNEGDMFSGERGIATCGDESNVFGLGEGGDFHHKC